MPRIAAADASVRRPDKPQPEPLCVATRFHSWSKVPISASANCRKGRLQRPSLPQPPPIEQGEHGLFGDISTPIQSPSKPKAGSRPVYKFEMPDGALYALAGLFSEWRPRSGSPHPPLDTFSILTTEANELTEPIHNRMPVILHPRDYDRWLNDYDETRPPIDLLRPYESEGMRMTPANRLVGNVRNNGPEMLNSA